MEKESLGKQIMYYGILAIICIVAFLIAKYIVRNDIGWDKPPIDTSERV